MDAKPTVDMMAGLKELKAVDHYLEALAEIGYQFRPHHPVLGRLHFAKIVDKLRTHNLSLTRYNSGFWVDHLLLRDYSRHRPQAADAYRELKRGLEKKHPRDTVLYTEGKNEFIEEIIEKARMMMAGQEGDYDV
jgi:GrpB-like predicted nucleotidyltransferase (UPF0157 family)